MAYYSRPRYASTAPFNFRAKGDSTWLKGSLDFMQETTRSPQEQIVWGVWGEPRLSSSDQLLRSEAAERQHHVDQHGRLAQCFFGPGSGVGHSTATKHGPPKMPAGARVGEHVIGRASELDIRTAAGDLNECMEYISAGFDPNARDTAKDGYSLLHYAAMWDRTKIVELLLAHGANVAQRSFSGVTAAQIAKDKGHYGVLRILQRAQASTNKMESCWRTGVPSQFAMFEATPLRNLSTGGRSPRSTRSKVAPQGLGGPAPTYCKNEVLVWLEEIGMGRHVSGFTSVGLLTYQNLREVGPSLTEEQLEKELGIMDSEERAAVFAHLKTLN